MEVYNNWQRIKNGKNPELVIHQGELYQGHKTLAIVNKYITMTMLFIGIFWGLPLWSIQTARGGYGKRCDYEMYSSLFTLSLVCAFLVVYVALAVLFHMPDIFHVVDLPYEEDNMEAGSMSIADHEDQLAQLREAHAAELKALQAEHAEALQALTQENAHA